jgi:DDE superfamily endonuclease
LYPVFVQARTWQHAQMLVLGALLVSGQRTVCSILRIIGLRQERHFVTYHRVLNRAVWDSRLAARLLLKLLVETFVPTGPVLLGVDDSIERRRGKQISAKGTGSHRARAMGARLSRPGAIVALLLRQDQRPALAEPDAAQPDALGRTGLGPAIPDRAGTVRALLPEARTAA